MTFTNFALEMEKSHSTNQILFQYEHIKSHEPNNKTLDMYQHGKKNVVCRLYSPDIRSHKVKENVVSDHSERAEYQLQTSRESYSKRRTRDERTSIYKITDNIYEPMSSGMSMGTVELGTSDQVYISNNKVSSSTLFYHKSIPKKKSKKIVKNIMQKIIQKYVWVNNI